MSNRCKHSEYWPKKKKKSTHKHTLQKETVLKIWIRLGFHKAGGKIQQYKKFMATK